MATKRRLGRGAAAVIALAFFATGCASGSGGSGRDLIIAHVHGLGIEADVLFVATHTGLFAYDDGEWSQRSEDRADHMGFSLVSDELMFRSGHPEAGGNLGVERSTDGGRTWAKISDVLDSPVDFHAMASSRSRPVALYGWSQGLFRAMDDPAEWEPVRSSGVPTQIGAMAVDEEGRVYASTPGGVSRSAEGGEQWKPRSSEAVFALAVGGEMLFASKAQDAGVLRSSDGGESWDDVSEGLGSSLIVALAAAEDGRTVVAADQEAGIWQSENEGTSWKRIPTP